MFLNLDKSKSRSVLPTPDLYHKWFLHYLDLSSSIYLSFASEFCTDLYFSNCFLIDIERILLSINFRIKLLFRNWHFKKCLVHTVSLYFMPSSFITQVCWQTGKYVWPFLCKHKQNLCRTILTKISILHSTFISFWSLTQLLEPISIHFIFLKLALKIGNI